MLLTKKQQKHNSHRNLPVKRTIRSWWGDSVLPWSLPISTHDFWNSKFWMPKVCKRGRTLPMLVRSSPNACCCQWMAAMAHTALPTERCASVWKCGCQRLLTKMWLSSSVKLEGKSLRLSILFAYWLRFYSHLFFKTETKPATKSLDRLSDSRFRRVSFVASCQQLAIDFGGTFYDHRNGPCEKEPLSFEGFEFQGPYTFNLHWRWWHHEILWNINL